MILLPSIQLSNAFEFTFKHTKNNMNKEEISFQKTQHLKHIKIN